jgi:integrase
MRWKQVDLIKHTITVGHSKSRGGEGRVIPLNDEAFEVLVERRSLFSNLEPDRYVFPSERYGFNGDKSYLTVAVAVFDLAPTKSMGS